MAKTFATSPATKPQTVADMPEVKKAQEACNATRAEIDRLTAAVRDAERAPRTDAVAERVHEIRGVVKQTGPTLESLRLDLAAQRRILEDNTFRLQQATNNATVQLLAPGTPDRLRHDELQAAVFTAAASLKSAHAQLVAFEETLSSRALNWRAVFEVQLSQFPQFTRLVMHGGLLDSMLEFAAQRKAS